MRILLSSNTPWGWSGYSTQSRLILKALQAMGHELAVYAWYGMEGQTLVLDEVPVFPKIKHPFGGDAAVIAKRWGADLVLSLQDIWPLPEDFGESVREAGARWLAYFPIDGTPIPPTVKARAESADYRVVYSYFAVTEMARAGLECVFIPHMIDTRLFSPGARQAAREAIGVPDDVFMVVMVATNVGVPSRKSFPEAMAAFKMFNDRHPRSWLFLHTEKHQQIGRGYNLGILASQLGLTDENVKFIDQESYMLGMSTGAMANLYRAADVLLSPSMGEGFGLPIAEAQACGTPVVTQACTSMSELTQNGYAVRPLQRFYTAIGHWQFAADIDAIDAGLESIYRWDEEERRERAAAGRQFIEETYSIRSVMPQWKALLEDIEAERNAEPVNRYSDERHAEPVA